MFTIRKARIDDCGLINQMAGEVFPATYQEILSPGQLDYMMDCPLMLSGGAGHLGQRITVSRKYPETNGRRRSCLFYRI